MTGLVSQVRSLWTGLRRRRHIEADVGDEFRHHLEMRTEDLIRGGISPAQAARQARLEFGHIEGHREDARAARGLHVFDQIRFSWLDAKLGLRMLVRYPGLTLVGGLALAFAIFVGVGTFHFINQMLHPTLPLAAGERIVGLRYWDREKSRVEGPLADDLRAWQAELRGITNIGGFRTLERNLAVGVESGEPARVAVMSASGFRVAGVAPLLGRTLLDGDAEHGAQPVVVLGHRLWQQRLGGDPTVVGRMVRLGGTQAMVVGVMPEGFAFPRDHMLWMPLHLHSGTDPEPGEPLQVFGKLAAGTALPDAQAEASALLARTVGATRRRDEHLHAQVLPYTESLTARPVGPALRVMIYQLNIYAALFLVLVSANVALLMFARTATREREIVVRAALGASRGRIVTQLFAEALVLTTLATALGLAVTGPALKWVTNTLARIGGELPFWFQTDLSLTTVVYASLLALLSAVVSGVVPALKATGRGIRSRLSEVGAGAGGLRLGGIWTFIVITQIAATVAFSGIAYVVARQAVRSASLETYFPAGQYLAVRLEMEREDAAQAADTSSESFRRRYAGHVGELERRIGDHPAVSAAVLAEQMPIKSHATVFVETDDGASRAPGTPRAGHEISSSAVGLEFFDVLRSPILAGRAFTSGDLNAEATPVIVTKSFVDEVLSGRSAIGRRLRYLEDDPAKEPGPWHPIVGVVRDLGADRTRSLDLEDPARARVYHPLDPARAGTYPLHLVVHVRGNPDELVPVLHQMGQAVSPALQVHQPLTLDQANHDLAEVWLLYARLIVMVSTIALVLSLAGIYAVMSFTVSRRTVEIGVRVALGARPWRVVTEIFRKPFVQIGTGITLGCVLLGGLVWTLTSGRATMADAGLLMAWCAGMLVVCALACIGPTLRALRIQPAEALNAET